MAEEREITNTTSLTVGELKRFLEGVPDEYEIVANVMNCVANVRCVTIPSSIPGVFLRDRPRTLKKT